MKNMVCGYVLGGADHVMVSMSFGGTGHNLDFLGNVFMSMFLPNNHLSIDTTGSYLHFTPMMYYYILNINKLSNTKLKTF